ncbi:MAG: hypothetical protein HS116_18280 [Planctomycetes bacterium]|nr:hypothetical protein [Planctomycetota bacterium]
MTTATLTQSPAPIVASARNAELPGLGKLVKDLKPAAVAAWRSDAEARLQRLELCRELCVFGEREEVLAEIEKINRPDGKAKPGRPKTGYRLAMERLSTESGVPFRTLERWMLEWRRFADLIQVDPSHAETLGDFCGHEAKASKMSLEAWISSVLDEQVEREARADNDLLQLAPQEFARKLTGPVAARIARLCQTETGHARMLPAPHRKALCNELNAALHRAGLVVMEGRASKPDAKNK